MLDDLICNKEILQNKNCKINNDKEYLLTVIMRLGKIFPNTNLYKLVWDVINNNCISIDDKGYLNDNILLEIERCEEYVRFLKNNC